MHHQTLHHFKLFTSQIRFFENPIETFICLHNSCSIIPLISDSNMDIYPPACPDMCNTSSALGFVSWLS